MSHLAPFKQRFGIDRNGYPLKRSHTEDFISPSLDLKTHRRTSISRPDSKYKHRMPSRARYSTDLLPLRSESLPEIQRQTVTITPIIQLFCDKDFNILRVNEEAEILLDQPLKELYRMSLFDLLHSEDLPALKSLKDDLTEEEIFSQRGQERKMLVSNVHPSFYMNTPPAMLTMAAPDSFTFEMDTNILIRNDYYQAYN